MKNKEGFVPTFYGSATVGPKGQVVIPAKLRKEIDIKSGGTLIFLGMLGPKEFFGRSGLKGFMVIKAEELLRLQKELERLQKRLMGKVKK
jgi:AbrB family looped-hinge helix DNA binding protein